MCKASRMLTKSCSLSMSMCWPPHLEHIFENRSLVLSNPSLFFFPFLTTISFHKFFSQKTRKSPFVLRRIMILRTIWSLNKFCIKSLKGEFRWFLISFNLTLAVWHMLVSVFSIIYASRISSFSGIIAKFLDWYIIIVVTFKCIYICVRALNYSNSLSYFYRLVVIYFNQIWQL